MYKLRLNHKHRLRALGAALLLQGLAGQALAETYTVTITDMDIGVVTSGVTGDTVFRVDPATGGVVRVTGSGTKVGSGGGHAVVTIACAASAPGDCTSQVNVKIAVAGSPTKRARSLTRILTAMGTAVLAGGPLGGPPGTLTIAAIGASSSKTFFIGADLGIAGDDSGLATGDAESDFSVLVASAPAIPTTGAIGRATARVLRSIAMTKASDLDFGRITLPTAASGTVTLDPSTGSVAVTGGIAAISTPTPTRAVFNVSGEGGQAFTVSMPSTFTLTGTATPLTVTTTNSAGASPALNASLGSLGVFAFGVGGSFPLASTTVTGTYSGNFTVTVTYN